MSQAVPKSVLNRREPSAGQHPETRSFPALRVTAVVLCLAALTVVLVPFWAPLLLAAWTALLSRPLHERLAKKFGGRESAAGVLTIALIVIVTVPVVGLSIALISQAIEFVKRLMASSGGLEALQALVSGSGAEGGGAGPEQWSLQAAMRFAKENGPGALRTMTSVAGAVFKGGLAVFVFMAGAYSFLVNGSRIYGWLVDHAPLAPSQTHRLAAAFNETGRGMFIGFGLTALLQATGATIGYASLGLPQWGVLGMLTLLASIVPAVGAGAIWVPVTVALAINQRWGAAGVMLAIGAVVSIGDNFVRPALARYGKLELPSFLVFLAMLGGILMLGPWGLLAGPLFVRLAIEALRMIQSPALTLPKGSTGRVAEEDGRVAEES